MMNNDVDYETNDNDDKNTIRAGGSTALKTADTVDMVYIVDMVHTVDMVYTVDMIYIIDTIDTVYIIQTGLH